FAHAHLDEVYPLLPFEPVSGRGVFLEDAAGRRVLDFYGGHAVAALGYGHAAVADAIARQAREPSFQSNPVHAPVRDHAADGLASLAPPGLARVFFVNSGAEANENALKLALAATGRTKVVAVEHSFHGRTAAAGAATWGARQSWYGFPRTPFDVVFVPRNDRAALEAALDSATAAFTAEPVQGLARAFDLAAELLAAAQAACRRTGAFFILDAVQTGMGRMGAPFGAQTLGLEPDLLTVAKGLGNGFPCGAVLMRHDLAKELKPGALGTTFGGGPFAARPIKASADPLRAEGRFGNVREWSALVRSTCVVGPVEGVQGAGLLLGLRRSEERRGGTECTSRWRRW